MPSLKGKKIRIAMLGHKRIPSREGGIEIVVGELAKRIAEKGYEITCFNRSGHHVSGSSFDTEKLTEYQGVRLKDVWTFDKKGLAAMTASYSAAIRAAFGPYDVIHFHAEGPCAAMWIPKLFGKKCIATIHGLDHQRAKWGRFASWYIQTGEKTAVRFADEIIVLSKNIQNYFMETYGRETVFIPNGISRPIKMYPDEITKKHGLNKDEYILFFGRLVPEKGIVYLIEAFKQISTDKKLVVAGGVSDSETFATEIQKLAADDPRILFTGFVQGQVMQELYSNAYFYVLPSDLEGMPLSLLEAMSYGNCCLTSDIPECTEVVGTHGLTFPQGNVSELANKLQELCDSPQIVSSYKEDAADYICNRYNWDDITMQTLELYGIADEVGS